MSDQRDVARQQVYELTHRDDPRPMPANYAPTLSDVVMAHDQIQQDMLMIELLRCRVYGGEERQQELQQMRELLGRLVREIPRRRVRVTRRVVKPSELKRILREKKLKKSKNSK